MGPLIAPDQLSFSHPDAWKSIHGHQKGASEFTKSAWFYNVSDQPANITNETTRQHGLLRRQLAHGFSEKSMREQEPLVLKYVDKLINQVRDRADQTIDLGQWYNFATFDIIGDLVFGEPFHCLQSGEYNPWIANIFESGRLGTILQALAFVPTLKSFLLRMLAPRSAREAHEAHTKATRAKMSRRLQAGQNRPDLIEGLIARKEELGLSLDHLISNAEILIIGGSETTATLLSGVTFLLLKHPDCLKKATEEVRASFTSKREINLGSVGSLTYMLACLNEALRMYPPIANGLPRRTPDQGAEIIGRLVPGGTDVAIHHWSLYRREKYFKHAMEFHPERFLDDPEFAEDCRDALQPFHLGPRGCLGRNLAYAEMRLILARILYAFDLSLDPGSNDWMNQRNFLMWKKGPLMVRCTPSTKGVFAGEPKFTKRLGSHKKIPRHRPNGCTSTELVPNGGFNRDVQKWEWITGSAAQFFWVKDSKKRPAHSGAGQAYIFLNRGISEAFLTSSLPAIEFGNSITVSAWLRYEPPADVSGCTIQFGNNADANVYIDLTPQWTRYAFESVGTGRPTEVQFRISCESSLPISVYLDDVSASACVPKKPNPACQVLPKSLNCLVNGGFECPSGIDAWVGTSLFGNGNESIAQFGGKARNPTHSGTGVAGLLLDNSQVPFSGVYVYQYGINDDVTRVSSKASFWLAVDSKLSNVQGCLLNVATTTGAYVQDQDISDLTTSWRFFEVKNITPTTLDAFYLSVSQCTSPQQPLIYLDDVYFGVDPASGPAPAPTIQPPPPQPTTSPCTTTPTLVDPSFEIGDTLNWLFFDFSTNFDATFLVEDASTYGVVAHAGSKVGALTFPSGQGQATLQQQLFGLCNGQTYSSTIWFQVAPGYDASRCILSYGITSSTGNIGANAAGSWTKVDLGFYASLDSTSILPYTYLNVACQGDGEVVLLVDDITFGPPPTCSITPTIQDGSFESGGLPDVGFAEGDETAVITTSKAHTGKKSLLLTFPSIANGAGFSREFSACVGQKLTFSFWYFVPKTYKSVPCTVSAYAWYTGESISDDIVTFGSWVEAKLNFTNGAPTGHVDFSIGCRNQLQKVVVYLDDVSVVTR